MSQLVKVNDLRLTCCSFFDTSVAYLKGAAQLMVVNIRTVPVLKTSGFRTCKLKYEIEQNCIRHF